MKYCYPVAIALFLNFFCKTTLSAQCPVTVSAGEDIYLCAPPSPTQLDGSIDGDYLNFTWSPTSGMTGSNTLNPTVTVSTTTNYVLTVRAADLSNNLISNGDFEAGNVDFTSDYIYNPGNLVPEGYYDVLDNPQDDHPGFAPCTDHTSGSGNMMVVNGAGTPNQNVWCQTVTVTPNTQYVFSAWATSVVAASPALLQFSINGAPIGGIFSPPGGTCNWGNFFQIWNSGSNGSATICIVNQNTTLGGNDFALDDILFAPTCLVRDTVTVHVVNITAVAAPPVTFIPCEGANVTLSGVGSSTGPNISYSWDTPDGNIVSGGNTLTPTVNTAGTYTLTVTFDNGFVICTKTATVAVTETPNPLAAWITPPPPIGCGSSTVTLIGNTNQSSFATYQWTTTDGNIVSGQNSKNAVVNQPGTYTLLVTNTNTGCTATAEVTVNTANNPPLANATTSDTITCIKISAQLSGAGSSSGASITYAWTTPNGSITAGQNSLNATAGAGGTYILAVTNTSNNCTTYDTVAVASNTAPPNLSIQPPANIDCDTDTLTLSASATPANSTALWTASNGGNIASGQNTFSPQITAVGTYTLTATNPANGCSATASVSVGSDYTPPVAVVVQPADSLTCQQSSVTLSGNGSSVGANFAYNWMTSTGGNIVSGQNTLAPVVNAAGTYTLVVTNTLNACTASASLPVVADTNIVVAIANAPDSLTCLVDTVTLNANGSSSGASFTYLWTTSNGNITGGANTPNPTANQPGTYQLLLTNTANGCSATDLAVVTQNIVAPNIQVSQPDTLTCANPSQSILAQNLSLPGNFSYNWTASNGGNIVSGQDTLNPVVNAAGIYVLTTANLITGCAAQDTVTVAIETGTPVAIAASPGALTCSYPTQILNSSGSSTGANFTYQWTTMNGHIVGKQDTVQAECDAEGLYVLQVTDPANGCSATDSVKVAANQQIPPVAAQQPEELTCVQALVTIGTTGSAPSFIYDWQTPDGQFVAGQNTPSPTVNAAGTYNLTVTDTTNGCFISLSVNVLQDTVAPIVVIAPPYTLTCNFTQFFLEGDGTGDATWTTADGNIVSGGDQFGNCLIDAPGTYVLNSVDPSNGCTATASVTVQQDVVSPLAQAGADDTLSCSVNSLAINSGGSGSPFLSFLWTASNGGNIVSGADSLNPIVDAPGTYILLVTNTGNGCIATDTVQIFEDVNTPQANAGPSPTLTCTVAQTNLNATASAGANFTYSWTVSNGGNILSGQNTLSPLVNEPGTYTLSVVNLSNGCVATAQVTVNENIAPPPVGVAAPGILTCADTTLTLFGSPASGNYTWLWTTGNGSIISGANTPTPVIDQPGAYSLFVTDLQNGCSATALSIVSKDVTAPVISVAAPGTLTCIVTSLPLSGSVNQPAGNFTATWTTNGGHFISGQNTLNPVVDAPGVYFLMVKNNQNGCEAAAQTTVFQNVTPPIAQAAAPDEITCTNAQANLDGSGSSVGANFSYGWSGGQILNGQNTLNPAVAAAGTYILTVTDETTGCSSTATAVVEADLTPPPVAIAAPEQLTCVQTSATITANLPSSIPSFSANWTTSNGHFVSGQNTLLAVVDQPGDYFLSVTNLQNGCSTTEQTTVFQNIVPPGADAGPAPELHCNQPQAALLGSSPSAGNMIYAWATANGNFVGGTATSSPKVDAPGTYSLTVTDPANGCTSTDEVAVTEVLPPTFEPELLQPDCHETKGAVDFGSISNGKPPFQYSTNGGQTFANQSFIANLSPGFYDLIVRDAYGCTAAASAEIKEPFIPTVTLPDMVKIEMGEVVYLQPVINQLFSNIVSWEWSPTDGLTCTDCAYPIAKPLRFSVYTLKITDLNGCEASAKVQIQVDRRRYIYAPNVFSPDGDGENDKFTIYGRGVREVRSLQVFDRWGAEIFSVKNLEINDEERGWDGTFRGQTLNPAVFVWQASIEFEDGEVEVFAGDVTVQR